MGKQVSIYLSDKEAKRLMELAEQECRRLNDQARYLLLRTLEDSEIQQQPKQKHNCAGEVEAMPSAVVA
jgi:hypothetical protein